MNELKLVERVRADVQAPVLDGARRRLDREIAGSTARQAPSPRRSGRGPGWRTGRIWIAAGTAVTALAAGVVVAQANLGGSWQSPLIRPVQPQAATAATAAELVAYATRAAAAAPAFNPRPHQWTYIKELEAGSSAGATGYLHGAPNQRLTSQSWTRVDGRERASLEHGKLVMSSSLPGITPIGWPSARYSYLLRLPTSPAALKAVIVANLKAQGSPPGMAGGGIFDAVESLIRYVVLPPRLRAGLYGVLVSLPSVHFDRGVTDLAGRHGIGLYTDEEGYLKNEMVINPRTYAYMGDLYVALRAHTSTGLDGTVHFAKGQVLGWSALLQSGIVQQAGQTAG